jgi:hypothetical protein
MPSRSRPTQAKRAREKALVEKRQMKSARRVEQSSIPRTERTPEGEDPDIAGIVLGPQPHPFLTDEELNDEPAEEEEAVTEE